MPRRHRKTLKIILVGAKGRMGREITRLASKSRIQIIKKVDAPEDWPKGRSRELDLVVDFSTPEGFRAAVEWCRRNKVPLVSGTTGLKPSDRSLMKKAARQIPLLYSANMSLGIAVMAAMLRQFKRIRDWRFHMEETHHRHKKDKPSGTAKLLGEELARQLNRPIPKIRSYRIGNSPGVHQIEAEGPEESLLLRHTAHHRRVFARGAIQAAWWLFDKGKPGLYELSDLYQVD